MEFIKFILIYFFLTLSIIGYGLIFSLKLTKYNNFYKSNISIGYVGIFGIFFLILISYLTNLFFPHDNLHNLLVLIIGISFFLFFFFLNKIKFELRYFFLAYLLSFFAIFYFKSHDDFSYYHLSFINNLILNKTEFGVGQFDPAFNHVSSLFYFHSLFKTVITKDFFYQIGQLGIIIFVNTILFENIFNSAKSKKLDLIFFLSIFCVIFANIFFYRLAEHGTDRSAQILFFLSFILIIKLIDSKQVLKQNFEILLIIFTLIISIKSFYILYSVLFLYIYFKYFKVSQFLEFCKNFKILYLCFSVFLLTLFYNISHSGCFLYPVKFTCPDIFFWGLGKEKVLHYMTWYELWSKAGATPTYRVENVTEYLSGLNWLPIWMENYFFNKMSDYLLGILLAIIIVLLFFKPINFKFKNFKNYFSVYFLIFLLFLEWFLRHPSLRYGGYVIIFLLLTFPISLLLTSQNFSFKKKKNSIITIFLICLVIFAGRNVNRLFKENHVYKYNLLKNPYYRMDDNFFYMQKSKIKLFKDKDKCYEDNSLSYIKCRKIGNYRFYYSSKKN